MRMSGAIQVLRELLEAPEEAAQTGPAPDTLPLERHNGQYVDSGRTSETHT
jgi:hypothetical protein